MRCAQCATIAFVIDEFPVTHSANGPKVQKAKLREMAVKRVNG